MPRWTFVAGLTLATPAAAVPVTLHHQARLVNAAGAAYDGPTDVVVRVYDHATSTDPARVLWSRTFDDVPVDGGYAQLTLEVDDTARTLDSAAFAQDLWVGLIIGGEALLPRQPLVEVPRAAWAEHAGRIAVGPTPVGACTVGQIQFDTTVDSLLVCDETNTWVNASKDPCLPGTVTRTFTGAPATFAVPENCTTIRVRAWGGGGGGGGQNGVAGGGGGYAESTLQVSPGAVHSYVVGGGGGHGNGSGQASGGGGGGATTFFAVNGTTVLVSAGGGGGGGGRWSNGSAGRGGGGGQNGEGGSCNTNNYGRAGSTTSGGAVGTGSNRPGTAGTLGQGGSGDTTCGVYQTGAGGYGGGGPGGDGSMASVLTDACQNNNAGGGGGGGGGYYGGGGGGACVGSNNGGGGGGGGALIGAVTEAGNYATPGRSTDAARTNNAGAGGTTITAGNPGLLVISWP
jgi:hypothetical protein